LQVGCLRPALYVLKKKKGVFLSKNEKRKKKTGGWKRKISRDAGGGGKEKLTHWQRTPGKERKTWGWKHTRVRASTKGDATFTFNAKKEKSPAEQAQRKVCGNFNGRLLHRVRVRESRDRKKLLRRGGGVGNHPDIVLLKGTCVTKGSERAVGKGKKGSAH